MNRKLLFVVNTDGFFISHRLPIALDAMRRGYEVHIAASLTGRQVELQALGFFVHSLHLSRFSEGVISNGITFYKILRLFERVKPDVVHLVTIKPVIFGGLAARLAEVPSVVAAISGLGFIFVKRDTKAAVRCWLVGWLYRLALDHANIKVIFQNEDDRDRLVKLTRLSQEKTALIRGSGVDLACYTQSPLPQETPVVLLASRLLADKGVREFVQAARILKMAGIESRFVLVGAVDPGNPTSISVDELKQWVSDEVIESWGRRDDMPQVLASSHIVVLPSYYGEGLPKVLVEAAACGRAVVTTDHPGCRDAILPDVTGVLVPIQNATALASAIKQLLDDPDRCSSLGKAGRVLAERIFDVREVVARHMLIYDELASDAPSIH